VIKSLAYLGFRSPHAADWRHFGPEVLGVELADDGPANEVRLRIDDASWRLSIATGEIDDLEYIGWDVGTADDLSAAADRLADAGLEVHSDHGELAEQRSVAEVVWFHDPFGFRHELITGQHSGPSPFRPGRPMTSSFITGECGLGHIVLIVPDLGAATDFFMGTLGFRHSDDIDVGVTIRFAHCNPRHHTLAFSAVPGLRGLHHVMLEVGDPDDVGRAFDIVNQRSIPVTATLGRHPNDEMFSFYVRTPSGFELEYGSGGRLLDLDHSTSLYDAISIWGHHRDGEPAPPAILTATE
jgi:2,3-dihydroxybiphenyl 1,2-dioxygenase